MHQLSITKYHTGAPKRTEARDRGRVFFSRWLILREPGLGGVDNAHHAWNKHYFI